jgi:hypothetical protein
MEKVLCVRCEKPLLIEFYGIGFCKTCLIAMVDLLAKKHLLADFIEEEGKTKI